MRFYGIIAATLLTILLVAAPGADARTLRLITIDDPITPVTADYLRRNLREAAAEGELLCLVELDTPGGLDTSMREMVKDIFASPVPVAVYVAPSGARAASAGAVITLAADIAAMAPGTNIGAAHPVMLGEKPDKVMEEKAANDAVAYLEGIAIKRGRNADVARRMVRESLSLSADKALEAGAIDLIAASRDELLKQLEGRELVRDGKRLTLHLAGAQVSRHEMTTRQRILNAISNPNIAYILMMIGILGIFFELSTPGAILPGTIGGIALILAFFAFQTLPVNYAGLLLILLALVLFILEIKITSHGMLTIGGILAMVLGSLMLFESPEPYFRLSWQVIGITVAFTAGFFLIAVSKAVKAHRRQPATGSEGLVGEVGQAESEIGTGGKVFVRGEYWDARSDEPVAAGEQIEVVAVEGMRLKVRKAGTGD